MKIFVWLFIITICSFAFADEDSCGKVRLDEEPGCLAGSKVTNQGGDPSCYTHAAAIMMTCQDRNTLKNKMTVSPEKILADIQSLPASELEDIKNANTGRTCNTVDFVKKNGRCNRDVILEILRAYSDEYNNSDSKKPFDTKTPELASTIKYFLEKYGNLPSEKFCKKLNSALASIGISSEFTANLVQLLQTQNPNSAYQMTNQIFKNACTAKVGWVDGSQEPEPICKSFDFTLIENDKKTLQDPAAFKKQLHSLFDKPADQQSPVAIEYCSGLYKTNDDSSLITNRTFDKDINYLNDPKAALKNLADTCKFHASAIVGREKRPDGKCYFIIQNSWGASCGFYKNQSLCKEGKFWVEENKLTNNLIRVSHF